MAVLISSDHRRGDGEPDRMRGRGVVLTAFIHPHIWGSIRSLHQKRCTKTHTAFLKLKIFYIFVFMEVKICKKCDKDRNIDRFSINRYHRKDGIITENRSSICKTCENRRRNALRVSTPHKQAVTKQKQVIRSRRSYLTKRIYTKYGLTYQAYQDLLKSQDYKCAICGLSESTKGKGLSVDHCHTTGKVRGLLCTNCNLGIGSFTDDIQKLKLAISYLEKTT